jgi:hypothetical protein
MTALFGPQSPLTEFVGSRYAYLWGSKAVPRWADLPAADLREIKAPEETLDWERGTYRLLDLLVLRPQESPARGTLRRFELLAVTSGMGFMFPPGGVFEVRSDPPVGP